MERVCELPGDITAKIARQYRVGSYTLNENVSRMCIRFREIEIFDPDKNTIYDTMRKYFNEGQPKKTYTRTDILPNVTFTITRDVYIKEFIGEEEQQTILEDLKALTVRSYNQSRELERKLAETTPDMTETRTKIQRQLQNVNTIITQNYFLMKQFSEQIPNSILVTCTTPDQPHLVIKVFCMQAPNHIIPSICSVRATYKDKKEFLACPRKDAKPFYTPLMKKMDMTNVQSPDFFTNYITEMIKLPIEEFHAFVQFVFHSVPKPMSSFTDSLQTYNDQEQIVKSAMMNRPIGEDDYALARKKEWLVERGHSRTPPKFNLNKQLQHQKHQLQHLKHQLQAMNKIL